MLATIANPAQGDMAIVERAVATNANSYTAYVYDGENGAPWMATTMLRMFILATI